jgi:hypothetical protein
MSELNFPTKLIRVATATLTIVMCCVKIQNVPNPLKPDKDLYRDTYYLRYFSMSCSKLLYDEQAYKQLAKSTIKKTSKKHN